MSKKYKILIWGALIFIFSVFGWVVSVVLSAITLGKFSAMANIFGYISAAAIPISILLSVLTKDKK